MWVVAGVCDPGAALPSGLDGALALFERAATARGAGNAAALLLEPTGLTEASYDPGNHPTI